MLIDFVAPEDERRALLQRLANALASQNRSWFLRHPQAPPVDRAGVRYVREHGERWLMAPTLLRERKGDCEDLAAYEAGWLQARGIPARVIVRRSRGGGPKDFHATVQIARVGGQSSVSDPSARLGM